LWNNFARLLALLLMSEHSFIFTLWLVYPIIPYEGPNCELFIIFEYWISEDVNEEECQHKEL
jgi:hypothetical protein